MRGGDGVVNVLYNADEQFENLLNPKCFILQVRFCIIMLNRYVFVEGVFRGRNEKPELI